MVWTVRRKLMAASAAFALMAVGALALLSWRLSQDMERDLKSIADATVNVRRMMEVDMMHDAVRGDALAVLLANTETERGEVEKGLREHEERMTTNLQAMQIVDDGVRQSLERARTRATTYFASADKIVASALKDAAATRNALPALEQEYLALEPILANVSDAFEAYAEKTRLDANDSLALYGRLILALGILAALALFAASEFGARHVADPLVKCADAMRALAKGNPGTQVDASVTRSDEIGELVRSIHGAQGYVRDVSGVANSIASGDLGVKTEARGTEDLLGQSLSSMVARLRSVIGDIQTGSAQLGAASQQILAASREALQGTQSQAAAIQETTTSAGELHETVRVTEDRAKEIQVVMSRTVDASEGMRGQLDTVATMIDRIRGEMDGFNKSLLELAQQNSQIGEIMAEVGDIADQTQLLAINAGIEAAKAGDAGRGFSVVASEMRALADQSKRSAQKVRAIVVNVQRASAESGRTAESGRARLQEALAPMSAIVSQIEQLTRHVDESGQAVRQILAIVGQQVVGVEQITGAMRTVQGVVQGGVAQNQQLESAAESLSTLGQKLQEKARLYRLTAN